MVAFLPVALLLAAVPSTELEPLLSALGEEERRNEALLPCTFKELTVIEDVDGDGKVAGKVIREYSVKVEKGHTSRKMISEKIEGDPAGAFRAPPKDEEQVVARSAFHPDEQRFYRFRLEAKNDPSTATIHFQPYKPAKGKLAGRARVDLQKKQVRSVFAQPSEYPAFLDQLNLDSQYADTRCGRQVVKVRTSGEGGLLFIKARFRSDTRLSDYASKKQ